MGQGPISGSYLLADKPGSCRLARAGVAGVTTFHEFLGGQEDTVILALGRTSSTSSAMELGAVDIGG